MNPPPPPKVAPPAPLPPAPKHNPATMARLEVLRRGPGAPEIVERYLDAIEGVDLFDLSPEDTEKLLVELEALAQPASPAASPLPAHLVTWLDAQAASLNSYLTTVKWISAGQTWRDLPADRLASIAAKPDRLARAARLSTPPSS